MRIAIITGASSGFGREFARMADRLYRNLDEIWLVARREHRLLVLSEELHTKCRIFSGDLMERRFTGELFQALEEEKPEIRLLVNAAGYGKIGKSEEIERESQLGMIDLNCRALTEMTLGSLPYMGKGGRIIQIASAAAFCPQPGFSVYAASKSYVLSFTRALGEELRKRQISVTAVCPGPADTEFFDTAGENHSVLKNAVMAPPKAVVKKAVKDAVRRKPVSIYGIPMKAAYAACSVLPEGLLLKAMKRIWQGEES